MRATVAAVQLRGVSLDGGFLYNTIPRGVVLSPGNSVQGLDDREGHPSLVQGFYRTVPHLRDWLVIGPYQGSHGCLRIPFGKGVCGAAATSQQTQVLFLAQATAASTGSACLIIQYPTSLEEVSRRHSAELIRLPAGCARCARFYRTHRMCQLVSVIPFCMAFCCTACCSTRLKQHYQHAPCTYKRAIVFVHDAPFGDTPASSAQSAAPVQNQVPKPAVLFA